MLRVELAIERAPAAPRPAQPPWSPLPLVGTSLHSPRPPSQARADVYLLDDVLAAVDAEVGAHLWEKCILGLLKSRGATVVFVTHHTHTLEQCDHVVQLAPDGTISAQGSPAELAALGQLSLSRNSSHPSLALDVSPADGLGEEPPARDAAPGVRRMDSALAPLSPRANAIQRQLSAKAKEDPSLHDRSKADDEEDRARGTVALAVWVQYARAMGVGVFAGVVLSFAAQAVAFFAQNWWLAQWSALVYGSDVWMYIGVNIGISAVAMVLLAIRLVASNVATLQTAQSIHSEALRGVLGTTMAFFDTTPTGRLLNRFQKDLQVVDMQLSATMSQLLVFGFRILGYIYFIVDGSSAYLLMAFPVIVIAQYFISNYYRASTRELQRLDSVSKSPIYAAFTETLNGVATVQAMDHTARFAAIQDARFDYNLRPQFLLQAVNCWFTTRLELFSNAIAGLSALLIVLTADHEDPRTRAANAGLALTYAPLLTELFNQFLKQVPFDSARPGSRHSPRARERGTHGRTRISLALSNSCVELLCACVLPLARPPSTPHVAHPCVCPPACVRFRTLACRPARALASATPRSSHVVVPGCVFLHAHHVRRAPSSLRPPSAQLTMVETQMVSVERLHAYFPQVLAREEKTPLPPMPPVAWPTAGEITFRDVKMGYRPGLPDVLKVRAQR